MKQVLVAFLISLSGSVFGQDKTATVEPCITYFTQKKFDKALACFKMEYEKSPTIQNKFWMAHCLAEMGQITKAKPLFAELIRCDSNSPERPMSLVNLGNCYRSLNQNDSAFYYYDEAIKNYPKMAEAYFNKGELLYSLSKFAEARICFDKAIEFESGNWYYYQKRLEVCFASSDFNTALNDLLKVKELNPKAPNEGNLAYCYSMLKNYAKADSVYQLIYNANDPVFLNNYGLNKHYLGQSKEAKELIRKSLSLNPDNSYAYRNLAIIAIDENDHKNTCKNLNKAKQLGFDKSYGDEVNKLLLIHCK